LEGISSYLVSDHILNLFTNLRGELPDAKSQLLSILQKFLDLDDNEQMVYRFGRRLGAFTNLEDLGDTVRRARVEQIMAENNIGVQNIDAFIDQMMQRFI
jgi:hypothetical protein